MSDSFRRALKRDHIAYRGILRGVVADGLPRGKMAVLPLNTLTTFGSVEIARHAEADDNAVAERFAVALSGAVKATIPA